MVMISTLYSTAENRVGSLAQRIHFQHLEGAHGPIGAMAGIAIITALLVAFGNAMGMLISNTDSAAPAGVYRVVGHKIRRRELVAACLPIAITQEGLAHGYLRTGTCAGNAHERRSGLRTMVLDCLVDPPGTGLRSWSRSGCSALARRSIRWRS
jgi:hypothetical protein